MRNTLGTTRVAKEGEHSMAHVSGTTAIGATRWWPAVARITALAFVLVGSLCIAVGVWRGWAWFYAVSFTGESSTGYAAVTNGAFSRFGVGAAILRQQPTVLGLLGVFFGLAIFAYVAGASAQSEPRASHSADALAASLAGDDNTRRIGDSSGDRS